MAGRRSAGSDASFNPGPLRETGIELIGDVPWGTHFCQFYNTAEDLLDILVPYFTAGLKNNEFCMWVTSEPLSVEDAKQAMSEALPGFDKYVKSGQIEILPHDEWYLKDGAFDEARVLEGWVSKMKSAMARGYDGLRLTGNTFWLEDAAWREFNEYEATVDRVLGNYRIIALCTYSLEKCGSSEIIDVVSTHQFALIKRSGDWEMIESMARRRAQEAVEREQSEKQSLLDIADAFLVALDKSGRISMINRKGCEILGYSAEEIIGKEWFDRVAPEEMRAEVKSLFAQLMAGEIKPEGRYELPIINRFCVEHIMSWNSTVLRDGDGNITGVLSSGDDITEHKQAEAAVRFAEIRYRTLFERSPDGAVILDIDTGLPLEFNDAAHEQLGYSREEFAGLKISDFEAHENAGEVARHMDKIMSEGGDTFETRHRTKTGEIRDVWVSVQVIELAGRQACYSIYRDITRRKRAEEALREATRQAQRRWEETEVILDNTPEAHLAYLDRDFNFLMVNDTYVKGCGRQSKGDLIGRNHFDLFADKENRAIFERVRDTGEAVKIKEKPFEFPDQPERGVTYWDWSLTPVEDEDGQIGALVLSLVEVTEAVKSRQFNEALNTINMTINSTLDLENIVQRVMREAAEVLGADAVAMVYREGGSRWRVRHAYGALAPEVGQRFKTEESHVAWRVLAKQNPVAIDDTSAEPADNTLMRSDVNRSFLAVPLLRQSNVAGMITFGYTTRRLELSQAQVDFAKKLATSISLAIENAQLYLTEQESRADIQSYATRLSLLHEIGLALNQETDRDRLLEAVLASAAELTAAGLGCMLLTKEGKTKVVSVYYAPWFANRCNITQDVSTLHKRLSRLMAGSAKNVIRIPGYSREDAETLLPEGHPDLQGLLIGELKDTRERNLGYFLLSHKIGGADFTPEDVDIISLLASQSSVALVSAENFEREHFVAETLQSSLLPEVPDHDKVEVGLLYRSASRVGRIGGDFYDFIDLGNDKIAVAIGDVCGRGLNAATHTAMVKYSLRAYLEEGMSPGACLTRLNSVAGKNLAPEKFITLGLAVLDLKKKTMTYALAGHPQPILDLNGSVVELESPQTVPLGVIEDYSFTSQEITLAGETAVIMYTDGLIEARAGDGEQFGYRRLETAFTSRKCLPAQMIASNLVNRVMEFTGNQLEDDLAVVVVRPLNG